jgi:hypothetical protein
MYFIIQLRGSFAKTGVKEKIADNKGGKDVLC